MNIAIRTVLTSWYATATIRTIFLNTMKKHNDYTYETMMEMRSRKNFDQPKASAYILHRAVRKGMLRIIQVKGRSYPPLPPPHTNGLRQEDGQSWDNFDETTWAEWGGGKCKFRGKYCQKI